MWREKDIEKFFEDGEIIVNEGEYETEMFIIKSGVVEVIKEINGRKVVVAELGKGDFFGEMSLLENMPRSATIKAKGKVNALVLTSGSFMLQIKRDPSFAFKVMQKMSTRMRRMDNVIVKMMESNATIREQINKNILTSEFK